MSSTIQRTVESNGVTVHDIPHRSAELMTLRKAFPRACLEVFVDYLDFSQVTVLHPGSGKRVAVPANLEGLRCVTLEKWCGVIANVNQVFSTRHHPSHCGDEGNARDREFRPKSCR